jgi:hypothetical protein
VGDRQLLGIPVLGSTTQAGRRRPQELLSGKHVPGRTALVGRRGPQELLRRKRVSGEQSFSCLSGVAHNGAEVRGALAQRDVYLPRRQGLPHETLAIDINSNIFDPHLGR